MARTVEEIMTHDPRTVDAGASVVDAAREMRDGDLEPRQSIDEAVQAMREHDIRRLPVVDDGRPVGIVSLGDLAVERDPDSVLADISTGSPDQ